MHHCICCAVICSGRPRCDVKTEAQTSELRCSWGPSSGTGTLPGRGAPMTPGQDFARTDFPGGCQPGLRVPGPCRGAGCSRRGGGGGGGGVGATLLVSLGLRGCCTGAERGRVRGARRAVRSGRWGPCERPGLARCPAGGSMSAGGNARKSTGRPSYYYRLLRRPRLQRQRSRSRSRTRPARGRLHPDPRPLVPRYLHT